MKKLFHILCAMLIVSFGLSIIGCDNAGRIGKTSDETIEEITVPDQIIADIDDAIHSEGKNDYEFYVMKVGEDYMSIIEDCVDVYNLQDHLSPDMEDGQIACVVADVSIVTGGYVGYCNDIFVNDVKSITILDYNEVIEQVDIPVAGSDEFSYYNRFFKYEDGDDIYFVFLDRQYIDVYANGEQYMQYEFNGLEDDFSPFFESVGK